jgi:hypothetical protein
LCDCFQIASIIDVEVFASIPLPRLFLYRFMMLHECNWQATVAPDGRAARFPDGVAPGKANLWYPEAQADNSSLRRYEDSELEGEEDDEEDEEEEEEDEEEEEEKEEGRCSTHPFDEKTN